MLSKKLHFDDLLEVEYEAKSVQPYEKLWWKISILLSPY